MQLEAAGAQDGAQNGVDAHQPPAGGKLLIDHRIEFALALHHAVEHAREMLWVAARDRTVFGVGAQPSAS